MVSHCVRLGTESGHVEMLGAFHHINKSLRLAHGPLCANIYISSVKINAMFVCCFCASGRLLYQPNSRLFAQYAATIMHIYSTVGGTWRAELTELMEAFADRS